MAQCLEFGPQILEVVQLAVEHHHNSGVLGDHRLMASGSQVNDAEAVECQPNAALTVEVCAPIIGAAVGKACAQVGKRALLHGLTWNKKPARYATHQLTTYPFDTLPNADLNDALPEPIASPFRQLIEPPKQITELRQ